MSKAIAGAAELAGAAALFFIPGLNVLATPLLMELMVGLAAGGVALEAGAIAAAIGSQQGIGVTTRQAAGLRQIVYGTQRLGGTMIYQSTTGSGGSGGTYLYNYIIVLAAHEIDGIQKLFLDGREVYWRQTVNPQGFLANMGQGSVSNPPTTTVTLSGGVITGITATGGSGFANVQPADGYRVRIYGGGGSGATAYATNSGSVGSPVWTVHVTNGGTGFTSTPFVDIQGAFTFGGTSADAERDPTLPGYGLGYGIGPGGPHYNFDGKIYAEVRWGDQPAGDIMASLTRNDSAWTAPSGKNLSVQGCAYLYLNVGYDVANFPSAPEIKLTINGKNLIYDPRTSLTGFSTNWALQVADVLADSQFGLGDGPITSWPTDALNQLIAAANVCDQVVSTSQGNEANFAQHIHYDTSTSPGDALSLMMPTAAGRISRIGGGWYIWPAYWQGPSFTFDQSSLIGTPTWNPTRSFKDLVNRVNGTFIAPNYPYNVAGNLYDKNGWYYGTIANNWPFAWQPTNFPQYAQDVLHGYSGDQFLTDDGGVQLPMELALRGCISIVQAQRVAKVYLMRNRQQGSGSFPMQLAAMQMQPIDVMQFNFSALGWTNKNLEVGQFHFAQEPVKSDGGDEVPALTVMVPVQETDISVYEWSSGEELTPYDVPAMPGSVSTTPAPPTGLTLTDNTTTAIVQADGTTMPRLLVSWTPPVDVYVTADGSIEIQWQDYLASFEGGAWIDVGKVSGDAGFCYIDGVSPVTYVNVQVRSLRADGSASAWVQVNNHPFIRPRALLSGASRILGVTVNPAVAAAFADLPELGTGNISMTIATRGNPCLLGLNLGFASISAGGAVTAIGTTFGVTTGAAPPVVSISIAGDGGGASASVSWVQTSGFGPGAVWTPMLTLNGGSNYTTATATVVISLPSSNGDTGYSAGTNSYSCTLSTPTVVAGVVIQIQVLMDGAVIFGPLSVTTNASGVANYNGVELVTPSAASHSFEVQACVPSGSATSSTRSFNLIELA